MSAKVQLTSLTATDKEFKACNHDLIEEMVHEIFIKYDTDKNGTLNRKESIKLVNDMRLSNG